MRSLAVGALLVLVSTLAATPTEAVLIENPPIVLAPVPWEFSTATNTFSGEQGGFVLHALFDDLGNFQSGTFEQRGSPGNQLLMKGTVVGVPTPVDISGEFFFVPFALDITFSSPQLPIHVDAAIWDAYICHGGKDCGPNGPTSVDEVFTSDYSNAWVPVHNTLHTFRVPYPAAGALLGLGLMILVAIRAYRAAKRGAALTAEPVRQRGWRLVVLLILASSSSRLALVSPRRRADRMASGEFGVVTAVVGPRMAWAGSRALAISLARESVQTDWGAILSPEHLRDAVRALDKRQTATTVEAVGQA